ncbi:MAG: hypothetical protein N4A46_11515, partial [Schleiferiaceae bacterium]|nr:hypothetical protein [Schleiferiaceae bacterium]
MLPDFNELEIKEGEYQGKFNVKVHCFAKDYQGFLWIGTEIGLFRYDGYQLKPYLHDPVDSNSLSNNYIFQILCQPNGSIWVGTRKGVNLLDIKENNCQRFLYSQKDEYVEDIKADKNGRVWMTSSSGLYLYENEELQKVELKNLINNTPFAVDVHSDFIWLATQDGAVQYYPSNRIEKKINFPEIFYGSNPKDLIDVLQWNDTLLYVASYSGVFSYNLLTGKSNKLSIYTDEKFEPQRKVVGRYSSLVMDLEKVDNKLWIAYRFLGLAAYHPESNTYEVYNHESENEKSLISDRVYGLYGDEQNTIWAGTFMGMQQFQPNKRILSYVNQTGYVHSDNFISNLFKDSQQRIWISTQQGLYRSRSLGKYSTKIPHSGSDRHHLRTKDASVVIEDLNGNIWVAGNNEGLFVFPKHESKGHRVEVNQEIDKMFVLSMVADQNDPDILWIGTTKTLLRYSISKNKIDSLGQLHWRLDQRQRHLLWNSDGKLWGVGKQGLFSIQPKSLKVNVYKHDFGLVHSILPIDSNLFWLATSNGLMEYNVLNDELKKTSFSFKGGDPSVYSLQRADSLIWFTSTWQIHELNLENNEIKTLNLPSNNSQRFYKHAVALVEDQILFGGTNGITAIKTKSNSINNAKGQVVITSLKSGERTIQ